MEYLIGGAAVLISAISLQIGVSSNATQERLLAASTWPYVQYGTGNRLEDGTSAITLNLQNAGVGPAWVQTVQVYYEQAVQPNVSALLQSCCGAAASQPLNTITSDPARVLIVGETSTFLRFDEAKADAALWARFNQERFRLRVVACYCSVLEDCWVMDSSESKPAPVAQCPAVPERERWSG
jgi:hypothetical protein